MTGRNNRKNISAETMRREAAQRATLWAAANPEKVALNKRNQTLRYYGLSIEEYEYIYEQQQGLCAICLRDLVLEKKTPSIDHDHSCCPGRQSCGKCVRGILCTRCNFGLGYFQDNYMFLYRASHYLFNNRSTNDDIKFGVS